MSLLPEEKN